MEKKLDEFESIVYDEQSSCFVSYLKLMFLPTIVFAYFVLGYLNFIPFEVHKHSVFLMGFIFLTSLIFARHNAYMAQCLFKNNIKNFDERLKKCISENLVKIGDEQRSNHSFDDFAKAQSSELRNFNYSSVAAGVFPTMGILGTFISIAISMPDFSSSNTGELEREISILLSGIGTAFYVSIYGILLSLWWIFYEKMGLSLYDKDIKIIKENVKDFFWSKEEIEQVYLKENLGRFDDINTALNTLVSRNFLNRLSDKIEAKFELFEKMIKLEEDSVKMSTKYVKDALSELENSQEKHLKITKVYSDILDTAKGFEKSLEEMETKSSKNYHSIRDGQASINSTLQALNLTLEDNISKLIPIYENFSNDLKNTQENILENFSKGLLESKDSSLKPKTDKQNKKK